MKKSSAFRKQGFTLLEVLVASTVFALAILAIVKSGSGSARSVKESQMLFKAVQVAQSKMAELEFKYQKQVDRDGVKDTTMSEESGAFEAPFEDFTWEAKLIPSTMKLNAAAMRALLASFGIEEEEINAQLENPMQRIVLSNINKAIKENFAELVLLVKWNRYGRKMELPLVTHLVPSKPKITLTQSAEDFENGDSAEGGGGDGENSGGGDSPVNESNTPAPETEGGGT